MFSESGLKTTVSQDDQLTTQCEYYDKSCEGEGKSCQTTENCTHTLDIYDKNQVKCFVLWKNTTGKVSFYLISSSISVVN